MDMMRLGSEKKTHSRGLMRWKDGGLPARGRGTFQAFRGLPAPWS